MESIFIGFCKIHIENLLGTFGKVVYKEGAARGGIKFEFEGLPGLTCTDYRATTQEKFQLWNAHAASYLDLIEELCHPAFVEVHEVVCKDGSIGYHVELGKIAFPSTRLDHVIFFQLDDTSLPIIHIPVIFHSSGPKTEDGFSTSPFFLLGSVAKVAR